VVEVYAAAKDAVDRARAGGGPSVIEAKTYRWYDHYGFAGAKVGVDAAFGLPYRSDSEVRAWMAKDPIPRFKTFLLDSKVIAESEFAKVEKDVTDAVEASVEFARKSPPPDEKAGLMNVYAEGAVAATQFLA
jgi:pyruvate dehydrogenase E1 component alpha subunit